MIPPTTDVEADALFTVAVNSDPFTRIPPALLNSSDIYNYECATGLIFPFNENQLKSASYSIRIGEKIIYWDEERRLIEESLSAGKKFVLPKNSIVFIKTKEEFRLPNYIAMRFNLKINNVHKGILLGTGPLVDPGFVGHLLIPLHNLTNNDYELAEGQTFVWVEFTKISPHPRWDASIALQYQYYHLEDKYVPFPEDKKRRTEWEYLADAYNGQPIQSSIPQAVMQSAAAAERARRDADKARADVDSLTKWTRNISIAGGIVIIVGIAGLVFQILGLMQTVSSQVRDTQNEIQSNRIGDRSIRDTVEQQNHRAARAEQLMQSEITAIRTEIDSLRKDMSRAKARSGQ
jgi:deoxycytidine triphosphate deaminase